MKEYKVKEILAKFDKRAFLEKMLNEMSDLGWDFVAIDNSLVIFSREL